MSTLDFNWTPSKGDFINSKIGSSVPNRATLAETDIIINERNDILLVDPHTSGTWETWMFPYSSLILSTERLIIENENLTFLALKSDNTLTDVSNAMDEILTAYKEEYYQALKMGINQLIPELVNINGKIVSVDYSLKFSKTSNSYTAYRFEGKKIVVKEESLSITIPHIWLSRESIVTDDSKKINGKVIANNVKETIRDLRL